MIGPISFLGIENTFIKVFRMNYLVYLVQKTLLDDIPIVVVEATF